MTNGGNETTPGPLGPGDSWPPSPPSTAGPSPSWPVPPTEIPAPAPQPDPHPPRRGGLIGLVVVLLLTAAIVAVGFTVTGGEAGDAAEPQFQEVGTSIDGPSSDPGVWASVPENGPDLPATDDNLFKALPTDQDVLDLVRLGLNTAETDVQEEVEPGPVPDDCTDYVPTSLGGVVRSWSLNDSRSEISVRIDDMGDGGEAQEAIAHREGEDFLACIPGHVTSDTSETSIEGAPMVDKSVVTTVDQFEQVLLFDDGDQTAVFAWRQVDQYLITIKAFEFDFGSAAADLNVRSMDGLLDLTEAQLPT